MRHKVTKNMDKKTLFIVLITGLIITILGVFFNKILTGVLADLILPDTLKKYYSINLFILIV